ncbi:hypothetical protein yrohd0001_38370 [Yersinia rohdei ATCC 43380]|nr:hypothetical protein yrohd0001_38370 [Yersinia rohdei ATCC 43380]
MDERRVNSWSAHPGNNSRQTPGDSLDGSSTSKASLKIGAKT